MSSQGGCYTSKNQTRFGPTFEDFTLAHCEGVNREPPECLWNDQLYGGWLLVSGNLAIANYCWTCVIPEDCAQFLRYPNRVVVHVSVRSSRKCSKLFVDILDIAIAGTAVNMYASDTLAQRENNPTFTKPVCDSSVCVRVSEYIHRERHNR